MPSAVSLTDLERDSLRSSVEVADDPARIQQQSIDFAREQNAFVAACMERDGFKWANDDLEVAIADAEDALQVSPAVFAEQYGLGVSTLIDSQATTVRPALETPVDYRARLFAEELVAYDTALTRCTEQMTEQVEMPEELVAASSEAFGSSLEKVAALVATDPRIDDAAKVWSSCMAESGFSFAGPAGMSSFFEDESTPYRIEYENALRSTTGVNAPTVADVLSPEQLSDLSSLQQLERAAAVAALACDPGYETAYATVYDEIVATVLAGG